MVAARLLPSDPKGRQRVDHYELVGEIASGGMATVFLARRAGVGGFQRFVAIKRLHPHLAEESEFVEMFLDEARLAALIHHPNVISITEVGANERGYYLVMDYVEGDTLARLLSLAADQNTVMPIGIGLRIVIDMLTGLHAAHELNDDQGKPLGLVHRDVSPQNVMVGVDGIARLSDFGVARAATRLAGTRVGQLKGKIAYMAPEQAAADESIDRRADVFAAGIVLWEVLTGRRLFKSTNDAATLSRVVTDRIEPPVSVVEGIDSRLSDICMKALERPLPRRYQTAAQFADQLEQAASRKGLLATGREVSAYMNKVLGEEIVQQREAVRRWVFVSDSTDECTPTGIPRPPGSQSRVERPSSPPDSAPSTSRLRPLLPRAVPDSPPEDETMVGPPPGRDYRELKRWGLLVALCVVVLLFWGRYQTHRGVYQATAEPPHTISILGRSPASTVQGARLNGVTDTLSAGATAATPHGERLNDTAEPSSVAFPTTDSNAPITGVGTSAVAAHPAPVATIPTPSTTAATKSTRPPTMYRPPTPSIPNVDLSNPYR